MVGNASFPRAIVVHEVAKTQRALLHSVLPEKGPLVCRVFLANAGFQALPIREFRATLNGRS
jgi:hypothetical protein